MYQPQMQAAPAAGGQQGGGLLSKTIKDLFEIGIPYLQKAYGGGIPGNGSTPPAPPAATDQGAWSQAKEQGAPKQQQAAEVQPQGGDSGGILGKAVGLVKAGAEIAQGVGGGNPVQAVQGAGDAASTILDKGTAPAGQVQGGQTSKMSVGSIKEDQPQGPNAPEPHKGENESPQEHAMETPAQEMAETDPNAYAGAEGQDEALNWLHSPEMQKISYQNPNLGAQIGHLFTQYYDKHGRNYQDE